jgi:hypothetical protein
MGVKLAYPQDMRDALDVFSQGAGNLVAGWVKTLGAPAPVIYHYTNDVGLHGILESGQLWLTDIFRLNDPSEVDHGFSRAIDVLKRKVASGPQEREKFAEGLAGFAKRYGIEKLGQFFICSFSSRADDLGQWRAYADNGRGYALGFDAAALEDAYTRGAVPQNTEAFVMTYSDAALDRMVGEIIDLVLPLASLPVGSNLDETACRAYLADLYTRLSVYALHIALFFKHEAYNNEMEYRFLEFYGANMTPPNLRMRARHHSLVRYRAFDWRRVSGDALKEIVVGPAADREKAGAFAKECLDLFHAGSVPITYSAIPYRGV